MRRQLQLPCSFHLHPHSRAWWRLRQWHVLPVRPVLQVRDGASCYAAVPRLPLACTQGMQ